MHAELERYRSLYRNGEKALELLYNALPMPDESLTEAPVIILPELDIKAKVRAAWNVLWQTPQNGLLQAAGSEAENKTYVCSLVLNDDIGTFPFKVSQTKHAEGGRWTVNIQPEIEKLSRRAAKMELHFEVYQIQDGQRNKFMEGIGSLTVNLPPGSYRFIINGKIFLDEIILF